MCNIQKPKKMAYIQHNDKYNGLKPNIVRTISIPYFSQDTTDIYNWSGFMFHVLDMSDLVYWIFFTLPSDCVLL